MFDDNNDDSNDKNNDHNADDDVELEMLQMMIYAYKTICANSQALALCAWTVNDRWAADAVS